MPGDLGSLDGAVKLRLEALDRDGIVRRIWEGDHTVWNEDPTEITRPNRLGWLTVIDQMEEEAEALREFAAEVLDAGYQTAVLMGMGGSSLAPEVLFQALGDRDHGLELHVLDTTAPQEILALEREVDLTKALFIVSSKSGTTIETTSQLAHFWELRPHGEQFVAITDPGTPLAALGEARGFRRVFLNPESIGGRYSALSYFGLVPAALCGVDVETLVQGAHEMREACRPGRPGATNPGTWLGAVLGEAALAGRDKLTLVLPDSLAGLGDWIEQLVAESTGKEGKGIIPVVGEPLGAPEVYGNDRIFVAIGESDGLAALEAAGHPVVHIPAHPEALEGSHPEDIEGRADIGAEFFRWEFATAVAGHILRINPFDQPNVQQAKDAASRVLNEGVQPVSGLPSVSELLGVALPVSYVAILAYVPRTSENRERLQRARVAIRDRLHVATTLGFGPRYLHSTGQVHKGGPNEGIFFQLLDDGTEDVPIPGRPFGFRRLLEAQAQGDLDALLEAGRPATRVTLDELEDAVR